VQEVLAGRHPIPPEAMHLVLNRVRPSTLTPDEALNAARRTQRRLPPLAAVIRDDPAIEESASLQRPAYFHSDPLRQAARSLGDLLFALPATTQTTPLPQGKVYTMGPLRVRV
jgi:cellulose biosynthesis protein BcsQ